MMNEKGPVEGRKSRVTIALAAYRRSKPGIDHISQIQEPRHVEAMHIGRAGTARAQEPSARESLADGVALIRGIIRLVQQKWAAAPSYLTPRTIVIASCVAVVSGCWLHHLRGGNGGKEKE
jgi:hypothetical protein